jgi:hypothetical protein
VKGDDKKAAVKKNLSYDCCLRICVVRIGLFSRDDVGWVSYIVGIKALFESGQKSVIVVVYRSR